MRIARSIEGEVTLVEREMPVCDAYSVVIKTEYSALSTGTELTVIQNKATTDLGNSAVGMIVEIGSGVKKFEVGQRVAVYGVPAHAEYFKAPAHYVSAVPDHVCSKEAAFAGLGAIAIHALRQADLRFGESTVVVGLGILGQIITQVAYAAANIVFATDLLQARCDLVRPGCFVSADPAELKQLMTKHTHEFGVDSVLLCAGSKTDSLIIQGISWLRDRGKIVIVGVPNAIFDRNALFAKEAEILISRAGGPGRYDENYERDGIDYPIGYTRWTSGRNTAEFIRLLAEKRIEMKSITSNIFDFSKIKQAYDHCLKSPQETMGVLIRY